MPTQQIQADGIVLHTEQFGDPSLPPILLMMGAMSSGGWWPDGFCTGLAARSRYVVRYDHRDTGESSSGAPGTVDYSVADLAQDAVRVLDALGIASAHLVGMSLGGYLAQIVALANPSRVRTLTLIASEPLMPTNPDLPPISPEFLAYHAQASAVDWTNREQVVNYQVGSWRLMSGSAHKFDEAMIRSIAEREFDRTPNVLTSFNHASLTGGEMYWHRLHEISAPALIIHGTQDPVLPFVHARALKAGLANASLVTLGGTGHELHPNDWPTIFDAIEKHTAPPR